MSDNIIFMGTSKFAVPILEKISESKLNISAVYTQPPKKSSRGMRIQKTPIHIKSELLSLPIRTPNSLKNNIDEYNFIKKIKPTIVVVISYGQIIPKEFLDLSKNGFLNIHADFNKHPTLDLDRRLNVLIYLNKNWKESYGGNLELWKFGCF